MTLADGRLFYRSTDRVAHATEAVLLERITDLWIERAWWRYNRWADWPDIRREHTAELRALVAVARRARRLASAEQTDPITEAKGYQEHTESEMRMLWGDR